MATNGSGKGSEPTTMEIPEQEDGDLVFDDLMDEDDEIDIVDDGTTQDEETNKFDRIVGCLQDILMDEEFEKAREMFCRTHCKEFEDDEENKLVYTEIFTRYTELVESSIEAKLTAAVPGFSMADFMRMLDSRKDQLMMDVFDLLLTMGDFASFKEMMVDYHKEAKRETEGTGLRIDVSAVTLHTEDQMEGEHRPDLDSGLMISPAGGN